MALAVGQDFKARWLKAPEHVRQVFLDDLERVKDLLSPHTELNSWQQREQLAEKRSVQRIEDAYAQRKAELLEQQRLRQQQALEAALAHKRAEEQNRLALLEKEEQQRQELETKTLQILQQQIDRELEQQLQRYQRSAQAVQSPQALLERHPLLQQDPSTLSAIDNLRLRLELEAESLIEQATTAFRAKLHLAAQEEISFLIQQQEKSN